MARAVAFDIVVPSAGRPSLARLLGALAAQEGPSPKQIVVVDDRRQAGGAPLVRRVPPALAERLTIVRCGGRGPAAARNLGWRAGRARWVAFLDDDAIPPPDWAEALVRDLSSLSAHVGGSQGRIRVPLPRDRRATDWERNVAGLEHAQWASADIAYRRSVLEEAGGFDERFGRAYREDSDLALRVVALGYAIERGSRTVEHPVGPSNWWRSVSLQRGNADDALMRALHGRRWRALAGAPAGRLPAHTVIVAAALAAPPLALARRRRLAAALGLGAAAGVGELAWRRIAPGPRTPHEVARMLSTSVAVPFAACFHRVRGELRWRGARPLGAGVGAVLFDRDGTLIEDVPYNGDPTLVRLRPGASEALRALRGAGIPVGVISNQSGVARGLISERQVRAVNRGAERLLGRVDVWLHCPHGPDEDCHCRKPAPGLVLRAARALGVQPSACAVIGDIGADVQAARAAGARGVLVPNGKTLPQEIAAAPETAPDLLSAVQLLLAEVPA